VRAVTRWAGNAQVVDDDGTPVGRVTQVGSAWQAWRADTFLGWGKRRRDAVALFLPLGEVDTIVGYRIPGGWGMGRVLEADADTLVVEELCQIDRKNPKRVHYVRDKRRNLDRASAFPPRRARRPGSQLGDRALGS
jgi:hypothetical protein